MGAMKGFAEEVSCALGFGGELYPEGQGERVMQVASRVASVLVKVKVGRAAMLADAFADPTCWPMIPKEKCRSENPEFVDLVNRIDHELMDDPD